MHYTADQTFSSNFLANTALNVPAGTVDGDLLIIYIADNGSNAHSISGGGWTEEHNVAYVGQRVSVWWKIATASEPASYTVNATPFQWTRCSMSRIANQNAVTPVQTKAAVQSAGGVSTLVAPTLTALADELLISFLAIRYPSSAAVVPPGMTLAVAQQSSSGCCVAVEDVGVGATGTRTWNWSGSNPAVVFQMFIQS